MICVFHIKSEPVYICAASIAAILPELTGGSTLYLECIEGGLTIDESAHDAYGQWWGLLNEEPEIEIEFE